MIQRGFTRILIFTFLLSAFSPVLAGAQGTFDIELNEQSNDLWVAPGAFLQVEATGDGEAAIFSGEGCTGDIILGWYEGRFYPPSEEETVYYVGGRVVGTQNVTICKTITISEEEWVPEAPPHVYFHGVEGNTTVGLYEAVIITTDLGGEVALFSGATCSDSMLLGWISSINTSNDETKVLSAKARWASHPEMESGCFTITVVDRSAPIDPPTLSFNGVSDNVTYTVNTEITVTYSEGAEIGGFAEATCTTDPQAGWDPNLSGTTSTSTEPVTYYFMVRWVDTPTVTSPCYAVTFSPLEIEAPVLAFNGVSGDLSIPVNTDLTVTYSDGAEIALFPTADCTIDDQIVWNNDNNSETTTSPEPGTFYLMARWIEHPTFTSPCYGVTFTETQMDPPTLLLNSIDGDVKVPAETVVHLEYPEGAELSTFQGATCEGDPASDGITPGGVGSGEPNVLSISVRWIEHPDLIGPCHTITWTALDDDDTPDPIQRVTVNVVMSDDASAEGALWTLYAPAASQVAPAPYAEGVVGAENTFLLPELAPGTYRLEVNAFGYEPLDTLITLEDDTTEISVTVKALQPQPTEEPTTPTPIVTPTEVPGTETPVATTQPTATTGDGVTGLPDTGSGSGSNLQPLIVISGMAMLLVGAAFVRREHRMN